MSSPRPSSRYPTAAPSRRRPPSAGGVPYRGGRSPDSFTELLGASLKAMLCHAPSSATRQDIGEARERLEAAVAAIADRDTVAWPAPARELLELARRELGGEPAIQRGPFMAACEAAWPRLDEFAHFAWQDRADVGDGMQL